MLTPDQFDTCAKAFVILFGVYAAALAVWPFVRDYRQARAYARLDDLMAVADAVFGPEMERLP